MTKTFKAILLVNTESLIATRVENGGDKDDPIESMISAEMGWVEQSGISLGECEEIVESDTLSHAIISIDYRDGEREYTHKHLVTFLVENGLQKGCEDWFNELHNPNGEHKEEDGGYYLSGGEYHVKLANYQEITKEEFQVMKKYL